MGIAQHHDAVSGTAKQHVTDDYAFRVSKGMAAVDPALANMLAVVIEKSPPTASDEATTTDATETQQQQKQRRMTTTTTAATAEKISQCPLLNVSSCPATESLLPGQALALVVYNPLASARTEHVLLPVSSSLAAAAAPSGGSRSLLRVIDGATGLAVPSALLPAADPPVPPSGVVGKKNDGAQLAFSLSVPPLSVSTFFIEAHKAPPATSSSDSAADATAAAAAAAEREGFAETAVVSEGGGEDDDSADGDHRFVLEAPGRDDVFVTSDDSTGDVVLSTRIAAAGDGSGGSNDDSSAAASSSSSFGGVVVNATVTLAYYHSHMGQDGYTPSGAYVFRPDDSQRALNLKPVGSPRVVRSSVVREMRRRYAGGWATLTTRLWAGESRAAELEWTVGPIPVGADNIGKEVVVRYTTGLKTNGQWATDANGRDMMRRRRDTRDDWTLNVTEPVAGNYVPAGSIASLIGDDSATFHILPDRSQGVASIVDGELEAMVHRRVLKDDNLGVGEPLNETECGCEACQCAGLTARGTHLLAATSPALGPRTYRALQQRAQTPLVMVFAPAGDVESGPSAWAAAHRTTPVSLLTGGAAGEGGGGAKGGGREGAKKSENGEGGREAVMEGLPPNVHLVSFEPVMSAECAGCVMVRLAHLFESPGCVGYDPKLSAPVKVDLSRLFPNRVIAAVEEMLLSGVPPRSRKTGGKGSDVGSTTATTGDSGDINRVVGPVDTTVTLGPMEIRAVRVMLAE